VPRLYIIVFPTFYALAMMNSNDDGIGAYADNDDGYETDESNGFVNHIVTSDEMLHFGLSLLRFTDEEIGRVQMKTNKNRFNDHFGVMPKTACKIYDNLQRTPIEQAKIVGDELNLKRFLLGLYYLRKYPKESEFESIFKYSKYWGRKICWTMIRKIQALKAEKIVWPDDLGQNDIWVISVDGTQCWHRETQHPEFSQDRKKFAHKFQHAGLTYEIGISLSSNQVVWVNGPFDAGEDGDLGFFRKYGLLDRLDQLGKKAIGDGGYRGIQKYVSTPNAQDPTSVKKFKSRALNRHETFNKLTKVFEILVGRFRHSKERFGVAFDAVCVLCQYKLENEVPLYDILIEDVINPSEEEDYYYDDGDDSDEDV
jgi:hypothetical protein